MFSPADLFEIVVLEEDGEKYVDIAPSKAMLRYCVEHLNLKNKTSEDIEEDSEAIIAQCAAAITMYAYKDLEIN